MANDAFALTADVSQRAQVDRMVQQVLERWGRIDVLVNNAGIIHPTRLEEIGDDTVARDPRRPSDRDVSGHPIRSPGDESTGRGEDY